MNTMTIYLAGPIDDVTTAEATGWREDVAKLAPTGVVLFDPSRAWWGANQVTAQAIDQGNRVMIHACDGVLCNLGGEGRGFGSIREIEFARLLGKPVAIAHGKNEIVSLTAHDLYLRFMLEEALDVLLSTIRERQDQPHPLAHLFGMAPPEEQQ